MRSLTTLTVKQKLAVLVTAFVVGFLVFGAAAYTTLDQVKVDGPYYDAIVQSRDLKNELETPPVASSYVLALQMDHETDRGRLDAMARQGDALRQQYETAVEHFRRTYPEG